MASNRPSKLGVQFHFICRHTVPTSIQSSNYLPNSKPCCGRSLHISSRTPLSPSTACARPSPLACARSLGLSVQHSSPTQDMVNLIGNRSKERLKNGSSLDGLAEQFEAVAVRQMAKAVYASAGSELTRYRGSKLDALRALLAEQDREIIKLSRRQLRTKLSASARPPQGNGIGRKSTWTELALI